MKRLKLAIGDVFLASLRDRDELVFEKDNFEWIPQLGEKVVVMQIIALSKGKTPTPLVAISKIWYIYEEDFSDNLNVNNVDFGFITMTAVNNEFTRGYAKKITNSPIPPDMPFQIYTTVHKEDFMFLPFPDAHMNSYKGAIPDGISRYGSYPSFSLIIHILNRYHFGLKGNKENIDEHFYNDYIKSMLVQRKNLVSNYYPEATNNPQWILDSYQK